MGGGSSAAQGSSRIPDALETDDATAVEPVVSRTDETRVHEAVPEEYARPDTNRADAGPDRTADRVRQEPITATRTAAEEPVVEAFWFAVGSSRPVYDEQTGHEVFTLEPGDWEVGIEDRGDEFLVQDKRTGAMGVLRDLGNIERAPRD
ncbi:hypothetical protein AC792_14455 [Arthrobacter sp. RIT-PI-e]|nr:hypothetical protein AC792_14455 [Arthrobacter sp. RIT-PI-e]